MQDLVPPLSAEVNGTSDWTCAAQHYSVYVCRSTLRREPIQAPDFDKNPSASPWRCGSNVTV